MEDERIRSDSFDAEYLVRISDSVHVLGTPVVQVIFACVHTCTLAQTHYMQTYIYITTRCTQSHSRVHRTARIHERTLCSSYVIHLQIYIDGKLICDMTHSYPYVTCLIHMDMTHSYAHVYSYVHICIEGQPVGVHKFRNLAACMGVTGLIRMRHGSFICAGVY